MFELKNNETNTFKIISIETLIQFIRIVVFVSILCDFFLMIREKKFVIFFDKFNLFNVFYRLFSHHVLF